jgi:pimeloyl-ACP methyl ester carboxylesterase
MTPLPKLDPLEEYFYISSPIDGLKLFLRYDPARIRAPVGIIRGEWDKASTAADACWFFDSLKNSPVRRMITISRATHLIHLEESRFALYREAETFLNGNDLPNKAPSHKN